MNDENKTPLTHRVTAVAAAYLDAGGCKPIESEVYVHEGWVADLASFTYPSMTETKHLRLVERFNSKEEHLRFSELSYRVGFPLTVIVEVKTSRSDFQKDIARKFSGLVYPAHLCYLAYPAGMIDWKKELPSGWIGLETTQTGERMYRVRLGNHCWPHKQNPGDVTDLIARVAIRRDHRTRYAAQKALVKAWRARENDRQKQFNLSSLLYSMIQNLKGEEKGLSLKEVIEKKGLKVPSYLNEQLRWLETLRVAE